MKTLCLLLFLSAFGSTMFLSEPYKFSPQRDIKSSFLLDTGSTNFNALTAQDRNKYNLSIKLGSLTRDSCPDRDTFYMIGATLRNMSNDTLSYIDWSCSHSIWLSDNQLMWAYQPLTFCDGCDKNIITVYKIPPHQQKNIKLRASFKKGIKPVQTSLKVGIILQRVFKHTDYGYYFNYFMRSHQLSNQLQNAIWSNTVKVP
ncbi:MAG TPA: hypothetical protein VK668_07685 [Mucilaginibacter sp.]|nr:hypothetical protein [Mucilaginibacter sp.]